LTVKRCAVVYLARKVDGCRWMPRFLASLKAQASGRPYDLIVILKGHADGEIPSCLRGFRAPGLERVLTMTFDDSRFATEAFFAAAERFDHDAFLFFVSSAHVLAPDWADLMFQPLLSGRARLVGASSGFESLDGDTPYPNPSIRTTGFAMERADWLALERGNLSVRYGGNLFEAGLRSMTKQVLAQGGGVLVVGRNGQTYPPERWCDSATFRLSRQENLLFSDNRTDQFDLARPVKRRLLVTVNWGSGMPVVPVSTPVVYLRRIRATGQRLWWRLLGSWLILR
jgi:hypothetical protein